MHISAGSHTPVLLRHTVVFDSSLSAGHVGELPVHDSAGSQIPVLAKHTVPFAFKVFGGHTDDFPVQYAPVSQGPAGSRHMRMDPATQTATSGVGVEVAGRPVDGGAVCGRPVV